MSFPLHGFHWHAVLEETLLNRAYICCRQSTQVQFYQKESTQAVKSHQLVFGDSALQRLLFHIVSLSEFSICFFRVSRFQNLSTHFIYLFVFQHIRERNPNTGSEIQHKYIYTRI